MANTAKKNPSLSPLRSHPETVHCTNAPPRSSSVLATTPELGTYRQVAAWNKIKFHSYHSPPSTIFFPFPSSTKILRDLVNLTSIPNVKNGGNSATFTISTLNGTVVGSSRLNSLLGAKSPTPPRSAQSSSSSPIRQTPKQTAFKNIYIFIQ